MNLVQPCCRARLTAEDLELVRSVLAAEERQRPALDRLLSDEEARDLLLDHPALLRALLEARTCLPVSARLYFYVLVRHVLVRGGLDDRSVADYVAEMLAEFARTERWRRPLPERELSVDYLYEILAALREVDDVTAFVLRTHLANHTLFLSGLFAPYLERREQRRGAPGVQYYEAVGRASYRAARDHRLARQYGLTEIFDTLAEQFALIRQALGDLADRLLALEGLDPGLEKVLRQWATGANEGITN
ncbi:hypothetical protein G4L39_05765 [Limisphaera ngatamarikiensis]|jgi:hypothetical protein|uniref:Uncharacterized protein n=1 Tax=Limisphaera ngatamarikiensis TaxID=1324935 RepID=A0A6M1RVU0_9BACT|nr:hypothetical protein [Limisphaera ngatamarikiensis]NGO38902.1 hypothetical protein [Limisphaera ngatamarikiensis]